MDEKKQITSPIKAIRAYCLGCCYGSVDEVRQCTMQDCELYPFRFGKNPFTTRTITEEQKAELAKRAAKGHAVQKKMREQKMNISSSEA